MGLPEPHRLEGLSDGTFSVIITLLVLEILPFRPVWLPCDKINIERLRDAPAEWSRQFEALGLNPQQ
jgi:hypothetical protein